MAAVVLTEKTTGRLNLLSAPQAAAQAIREAIIAGELKGGDRILEQKWSLQLGIGQPTLREAMKELEHQGLLRRTTQRGTYVAELSSEDYRRILEIRIPLEAIAIGRAATRLTPEAKKALTAIVKDMKTTVHDHDVKRFHDSDVLFHRKIWSLAANDYLQDLLETITFRLFVFSIVGRWPNNPNAKSERSAAVRQHVGILKGICTGDARKAQRAFVMHTLDYWNKFYALDLDENDILADICLTTSKSL